MKTVERVNINKRIILIWKSLIFMLVLIIADANAAVIVQTNMSGSSIIYITLDKPFHIQKISEHDGNALVISFPDKASIIIMDGGLFEFPPDRYPTDCDIEYHEDRTTKAGRMNKSYWRIDKYKSIRIYYMNVSKRNKHKYDSILNSLRIKPIIGSDR